MAQITSLLLLLLCLCFTSTPPVSSYDVPQYDSSAYTECRPQPEHPLYEGGMFKGIPIDGNSSTFKLQSLDVATKYCLSIWIRISGADSALISARLVTQDEELKCVGTVIAYEGCWSFLKGGFVVASPSNSSQLLIENRDASRNITIEMASASLQSFTDQQWRLIQDTHIDQSRKRAVSIHVSDMEGRQVEGAAIRVEQLSNDFPFGSAIAASIIGNKPYQKWFVERFTATVFENELKWSAIEPKQGEPDYTVPDQMLEFVHANQMLVRGHNIFWENPLCVPDWVRTLNGSDLEAAVTSRIESLMHKYRGEFVHWDVNNEMLHYSFYRDRLGDESTLRFFEAAHEADPLATLFMNEFNVVEKCSDLYSTVDTYIAAMRGLGRGGGGAGNGIGLQAHFSVPNAPLMRAILDKLATLGLPMWLTELDISDRFDAATQAAYLEEVMREGFSHPGVDGIILWSAFRNGGCYRMCLTDGDFNNLPTGDTLDKLLGEWSSDGVEGRSDERGGYTFVGFLGEYRVTVEHNNTTVNSTFSLSRGRETKHFNMQV